MPDIPAEAVQAAAEAIGAEHLALRDWDLEAFARAALEAAAPFLAAQVRRETAIEQLERVARMVSWGAADSWLAAHELPPTASPCEILRAIEEWCRDAARQIGEADA